MTIAERLEKMAEIVAAGRCHSPAVTCDGCMKTARGFMHDISAAVAAVVGCSPLAVKTWARGHGVEPLEIAVAERGKA